MDIQIPMTQVEGQGASVAMGDVSMEVHQRLEVAREVLRQTLDGKVMMVSWAQVRLNFLINFLVGAEKDVN